MNCHECNKEYPNCYRRVVDIIRVTNKDVGYRLTASGLTLVDPRYYKPSKICRAYWPPSAEPKKSRHVGRVGYQPQAVAEIKMM